MILQGLPWVRGNYGCGILFIELVLSFSTALWEPHPSFIPPTYAAWGRAWNGGCIASLK